MVTKNACTILDRERLSEKIEFPVKDVVAENQTRPRIADKLRANQKRFCDSTRFRLLRILNFDSKLRAVA